MRRVQSTARAHRTPTRRCVVVLIFLRVSLPSLPPPSITTAVLRLANILLRRRAYTYADGFKPRRRHGQPSASYTFSRDGDFNSRRWHEHKSRGQEGAARSSGKDDHQQQQHQQQLQGPRRRSFQDKEAVPPTRRGEGPNCDIRVGEAWSERVAETEGSSQGQGGGGARGAGQQLPGEEGIWGGGVVK